jgi:Fe-S-cluster-containing dehydrogenase component
MNDHIEQTKDGSPCESRRKFLRGAVAGGALAGAAAVTVSAPAEARETNKMSPDALGLLFDATICVGCKACVAACKTENAVNGAAPEFTTPEQPYWDTPLDTSAKTFNIIKMYRNGTMQNKDQEKDGYAFMKVSCLHCVDPSCVSACPVSAMQKDKKTGIVSYNKDACIGCRYCVAACPFGIPKWDYDNVYGKIGKCELCRHRMLDKDGKETGKYSACAEVCPTGATLYGKVSDLMVEARKRLAAKPGSKFMFQRGRIDGKDMRWEGEIGQYQQRVYGEKEIGGTQMIKLSAVPFNKVGMPDLPDVSPASRSETIQHTLYGNMLALPVAVTAGLAFLIHRNRKSAGDGGEGKGE